MTGGKALIFSAPSGSGKTTIVKHLLLNNNKLAFSISACTRPKRENEINGKDYYFLTSDQFKNKIQHDEFVEWEEVYDGNYYGTLKSEVERIWNQGKAVVFDVDVKGGVMLKEYFGDNALGVFIRVPSVQVLKERLSQRGTESEESLQTRIAKAEYELTFEPEFDITIVNDNLEDSLEEASVAVDKFLDH